MNGLVRLLAIRLVEAQGSNRRAATAYGPAGGSGRVEIIPKQG